jgi:hypothetical protein
VNFLVKIVENSQKESSKSKKETITFSLEQDVLQEIRKDAQRQGLSINSIVNNILRKYVFFFKYAEYDQPILIPNKSFQVILNDIDETKQIEEYKAILTDLIPAIFMQEKIPFSFDNWIKYVFGSMLMYAGAYQNFSYHKDEEGHLCLVFKHNF